MHLIPLTPSFAATVTLLVALGAVWSKPPKSPGRAAGDEAAGATSPETESWTRILEIPLTGRRQALMQQITISAREIQTDVDLLPFEALKPAAQGVVDQQQRLIPEIRHNLHLAEWLDSRVGDLERRAAGELDEPPPPRPRPQRSLMGIPVEVTPEEEPPPTPSLAPIPLDPAVTARLAEIRERVAQMDAEAERVARLLIECEANLLATISERDEHRLGELFAEFASIFELHYQAAREVNQVMRAAPG